MILGAYQLGILDVYEVKFSIKLVSRWRQFENGCGRVPNMGIMGHYLSNLGVLKECSFLFRKSLTG